MDNFSAALAKFKQAAEELEEAWHGDIEVTGYPEYLPSFDEFVANILDMQVAIKRTPQRAQRIGRSQAALYDAATCIADIKAVLGSQQIVYPYWES